jgi:hypothetical protein
MVSRNIRQTGSASSERRARMRALIGAVFCSNAAFRICHDNMTPQIAFPP